MARSLSVLYAGMVYLAIGILDVALVIRADPGQIPSTSRLFDVQIPDDLSINLLLQRLIKRASGICTSNRWDVLGICPGSVRNTSATFKIPTIKKHAPAYNTDTDRIT